MPSTETALVSRGVSAISDHDSKAKVPLSNRRYVRRYTNGCVAYIHTYATHGRLRGRFPTGRENAAIIVRDAAALSEPVFRIPNRRTILLQSWRV